MFTIIHIIANLELGGAQQILLNTIRRLDREKFKNLLITGTEGLLVEDAKEIPNLKIYSIPEFIREVNPVKDFLAFFKVYRILKLTSVHRHPVIVHTHGSKGGVIGRSAARLAGIKIIIHTIHGFAFHNFQNRLLKTFYVLVEKSCAKISTKLIAASFATKEKGLKAGIGKSRLYKVIYESTPIEDFLRIEVAIKKKKRELGLDTEKKVVGTICCFKPQKAPLDFIKVAKRVSDNFDDVQFVIVGDGMLRNKIERLVKDLKIEERVRLLGWRRDVVEIIPIFDIFVLTSLWEGLPLVFAQVMCQKKPIVATAVDGTKEAVIDRVNGFLAEPHDIDGITDKVLLLLRNGKLAKKMGENGKKTVWKFDIDNMVNQIEKLYCEQIRHSW